eukprot:TRINITY_DN181_c1_g2_i4.p1 TRINITY_DN181_c1_g2~~TRINITY_DN181_c1_g2_i4.p1  ORF type:complete len:291 (-),score=96.41 TRINITY_DN181_c1_g2_i4:35-907(-)
MKDLITSGNPYDRYQNLMGGDSNEFIRWNEKICNTVCFNLLSPVIPNLGQYLNHTKMVCSRNPGDGNLCFSHLVGSVFSSKCVQCVRQSNSPSSCGNQCANFASSFSSLSCCLGSLKDMSFSSIPGIDINSIERCSSSKNATIPLKLVNIRANVSFEIIEELLDDLEDDLEHLFGEKPKLSASNSTGEWVVNASLISISLQEAEHKSYEFALKLRNHFAFLNKTNDDVDPDILDDPTQPLDVDLFGEIPQYPGDYPSLLAVSSSGAKVAISSLATIGIMAFTVVMFALVF